MPAVLCVHNNGTVSVLRDLSQEEAEAVVERLTFAKERETIYREENDAYRLAYEKARNSDFRGNTYLMLPSGRVYHYSVIDMPMEKESYVYGQPKAKPYPYIANCSSAAPKSEFSRVEII